MGSRSGVGGGASLRFMQDASLWLGGQRTATALRPGQNGIEALTALTMLRKGSTSTTCQMAAVARPPSTGRPPHAAAEGLPGLGFFFARFWPVAEARSLRAAPGGCCSGLAERVLVAARGNPTESVLRTEPQRGGCGGPAAGPGRTSSPVAWLCKFQFQSL